MRPRRALPDGRLTRQLMADLLVDGTSAVRPAMLKLFYICYFLVSGVSIPFFPAYLRKLGLGGQSVSTILAVAPLLQLGVPLVWGWLADRTQRPDRILKILCLGACVASWPMIFVRTMPGLLFLYVGQQVFAGSIMALADSLAVERSRKEKSDYSRIRLWGSLSFIAICLIVGKALDGRAAPMGDALVPLMISVGFAIAFLASLGLRGHGDFEAPHARDVRALLADSRFRFLLLLAGLHWMCLTPYHDFFGILLQDRGFAATTTSHAFFVGVGAEVAVFLLFSRLRPRCSLPTLFIASFAMTAFRWWLFAYTHNPTLVVATQALHGMTFGIFWASSMAWVGECVSPKVRATGQVLFFTTLALGKTVGVLFTGALYDATGGAGTAFSLAGVVELVPLGLAFWYWRRERQTVSVPPHR